MKILVSHKYGADLGFCYEGKVLTEVFRADECPEHFECEDIVVGRVRDVVPGLSAAFVSIVNSSREMEALGGAGYLPFSELPEDAGKLRPEQLLPVRIVALPAGTKPYRLSGKLALSGKYCAVGENIRNVQVSRKLGGPDAVKLKNEVRSAAADPAFTRYGTLEECGLGAIIRTNAGRLDPKNDERKNTVVEEIRSLAEEIVSMRRRAVNLGGGVFLHHSASGLNAMVRDRNPEELILDNPETLLAATRKEADTAAREYGTPLRVFEDCNGGSFLTISGLEKQLEEVRHKKVWMRSGAFLVIEKTEALVSIDVNSGKSEGARGSSGKDAAEEYRFKTNLEAADEIFHQIRLRNLSGMILIDFINISDEHREALKKKLKELCILDPLPTDFVDFTGLGLAEITRRKTGKNLADMLKILDTQQTE